MNTPQRYAKEILENFVNSGPSGLAGVGAVNAYQAAQRVAEQREKVTKHPERSFTIVAAKLGGWVVYQNPPANTLGISYEILLATSSLEEIFELIKNKTLLDV